MFPILFHSSMGVIFKVGEGEGEALETDVRCEAGGGEGLALNNLV
jgi:hypothetical protein